MLHYCCLLVGYLFPSTLVLWSRQVLPCDRIGCDAAPIPRLLIRRGYYWYMFLLVLSAWLATNHEKIVKDNIILHGSESKEDAPLV